MQRFSTVAIRLTAFSLTSTTSILMMTFNAANLWVLLILVFCFTDTNNSSVSPGVFLPARQHHPNFNVWCRHEISAQAANSKSLIKHWKKLQVMIFMRKFPNSTSDLERFLTIRRHWNTKDWTTEIWSQFFSMKIIVLDLKEKKINRWFQNKSIFPEENQYDLFTSTCKPQSASNSHARVRC